MRGLLWLTALWIGGGEAMDLRESLVLAPPAEEDGPGVGASFGPGTEALGGRALLGLTGVASRPSSDDLVVAALNRLVLDEWAHAPELGPSLGTLLGCGALADALADVCVGGACLGHETDLRDACEDLVLGVAVELAGGAAGLVENGGILGEGPLPRRPLDLRPAR